MTKRKAVEGRGGCSSSAAKKQRAANLLPSWLLWHPLFSSLCHNYPKDLQRHNPPHQEWLLHTYKKKETGKEFKTYDLVDVNGRLWYGVPIFTFWRDQVDKGAIPEQDMTNNYIRLYKPMRTLPNNVNAKPRDQHPKRNNNNHIKLNYN